MDNYLSYKRAKSNLNLSILCCPLEVHQPLLQMTCKEIHLGKACRKKTKQNKTSSLLTRTKKMAHHHHSVFDGGDRRSLPSEHGQRPSRQSRFTIYLNLASDLHHVQGKVANGTCMVNTRLWHGALVSQLIGNRWRED